VNAAASPATEMDHTEAGPYVSCNSWFAGMEKRAKMEAAMAAKGV
jgi:hypothetical protein